MLKSLLKLLPFPAFSSIESSELFGLLLLISTPASLLLLLLFVQLFDWFITVVLVDAVCSTFVFISNESLFVLLLLLTEPADWTDNFSLLQLLAGSISILIPLEDIQKDEEDEDDDDDGVLFALIFEILLVVLELTIESLGDCGDGDTEEEEFIDATELCGDNEDDEDVDDDDGNFVLELSFCSIKLLL